MRVRTNNVYLQGKNDHEDLLLPAGQDVLDEGPARTDQHDGEEQQAALHAGLTR